MWEKFPILNNVKFLYLHKLKFPKIF
jgi:hypothetical protein